MMFKKFIITKQYVKAVQVTKDNLDWLVKNVAGVDWEELYPYGERSGFLNYYDGVGNTRLNIGDWLYIKEGQYDLDVCDDAWFKKNFAQVEE